MNISTVSNSVLSRAKYHSFQFATFLFVSAVVSMGTSAHTTGGMTGEVSPVGIYKPSVDGNREATHRTDIEISPTDPSSASAAFTPNASAGSRSFFETLPRELRDAVYEYTFEHAVKQQPGIDNDVTFYFHAPVSNLRLVSRQFTAEYDERYMNFSPRNTLLSIVNNSQNSRRHWHSACPRLAARYKELKTIRALFDGGDGSTGLAHRDLLQKFLSTFHDTAVLIRSMPHLRRVDMRFDFESLHHSEYHEELLRLFSRLSMFKSWPAEGKYELRYQGLTYPQPEKLRELQVPNIEILDAPITLGTWNQASQVEQVDREVLEKRLRVEKAVLEAWKAKHGCTLWESKRFLRDTE